MALITQFSVAALFTWFVTSSLWIYPHSLSYFNETVEGPLNGPKHLLGSNVDWGQDVLYLRQWITKSKQRVAVVRERAPGHVGFLLRVSKKNRDAWETGGRHSVVETVGAVAESYITNVPKRTTKVTKIGYTLVVRELEPRAW